MLIDKPWQLCVAPMVDWTDRHCRYFHRLLAPHARLYSEMITSAAVMHGQRQHLLAKHVAENPVALQLGGHDPAELAVAAAIGVEFGYAEINLNVGCPSDRVQSGRFGACLMREPELVAACVAKMRDAVAVPVTVKCRIGVDEQDAYVDLQRFVAGVADAGCAALIVHARKAWLHGLSPKENRELPPLDYSRVYQLKQEFPTLPIIINGGINSLVAAQGHLTQVDGVMLGRAAYHDPYLLALLDAELHQVIPLTREHVLAQLRGYVEDELAHGERLAHISRHLLGLYLGQPGGRIFRRILSEQAHRRDAGYSVIEQALLAQREHILPVMS